MKKEVFLENLESYGLGHLLDELAEEQTKVIDAVRATAKQGRLVLELKFKRAGDEKIMVEAIVKPTIPRAPVDVVQMYADEDNRLHEDNPKAKQLDMENVIQMGQPNKAVNQL